jgi:hypothetical protein
MPVMTRFARPRSFRGAVFAVLAAATVLAAPAVASAGDDQAPSRAPAASPLVPPQPPPADKRGFFNEIGRWWNGSVGFMRDTTGRFVDFGKKSGDVAKDAALATGEGMKKTLDASKDAADVIVRLPNTRVVEMHATCKTAPNGAPDCAPAALAACRDKGFAGGKPLDVRTAEKCDTTQAWRKGQTPGTGACPIESWITRAICQ